MPDQTNSTNQDDAERGKTAGTKSILVAYATVHLLTGQSFQLLPFQHAEDVKTEVSKLIESWAESGFLLRGRLLYPWHQVQLIEVTSVEELSASQAAQSLLDWEIQDQYRVLDSFWKTRKPAEGNKDNKDQGEDRKDKGGGKDQPEGKD